MTIRRRGRAEKIARAVIAYALASIALTIVFFEVGGGHADIPFTTFPDYFVVAPALPLLLLLDLHLVQRIDLLSIAAFVVAFVAAWIGTGALVARFARGTLQPGRDADAPGRPDA